jgi:uncharacterized ParB-like nuclease family protein
LLEIASKSHNEYDLKIEDSIREAVTRLMLKLQEISLRQIHRPLPRQNDPAKVAALMESIREIGQQEPIDVLEVDGKYYGFSGCHRFEACQRLGQETILCRVRKAPRSVLQRHLA